MANEQDSWLEGLGVDFGVVPDAEPAATQVEESSPDVNASAATENNSDSGEANGCVSTAEHNDSTKSADAPDDSSGNTASTLASSAFGAVENLAGEAAEGATSVANGVAGVAEEVVDGVKEMAQDVADTASELYQEAKDAVEKSDLPYQFGGIQAPFEKSMEEDEEEGRIVAARPLTPGELADAKLIFGDSIDYSKVLVDGGSLASIGAPRTIGNTVHLTSDLFIPDSNETTTEGKRTLVHELTHVWQYQHEGWTYAPKALWAQAKAAVHGSRNGAYDWKSLVVNRIPWEEWNPEAQAQAVEDYNESLHKIYEGTAKEKDYDFVEILGPYVRNVGSASAPATVAAAA